MAHRSFDLDRFVSAQAPVFETVLAELQAGRKQSHWMWFIFPQLRGLGRSGTARFYGIASRDEARAYLDDPVLGPRLTLCTQTVMRGQGGSQGNSLHDIFGTPDDLKFQSCMTLFEAVSAPGETIFGQALDRWCKRGAAPKGERDARTLQLLYAGTPQP